MKNSETNNIQSHSGNTLLSAVKIGRKEYPIKKGDYILYNGSCYQFCSGDSRTLKFERFTQYTNLKLSASMVKKIPFDKMQKQNYKSSGMDLVRWFF